MIGSVIPDETRATCSDCPMCKTPEPVTERDRVFLQSTKCCTYSPVLPNFLVGGILLDEDAGFAEGKALFQREAPLLWLSPGGIEPHWQYWWHYNNHLFGESQTLRCPY